MAVTGRFAPSPSGRIHLGNILCCLLSWLSARQKGRAGDPADRGPGHRPLPPALWRADDPGHPLAGLGLGRGARKGAAPAAPYAQSLRTELYQARSGAAGGPGGWSTRASAPGRSSMRPAPLTGRDGQVIYPGTCRDLTEEQAAERACRQRPSSGAAAAGSCGCHYRLHGWTHGPLQRGSRPDCGDFLLRRSDGMFAYQLAVVVDDAAMGVTEVVRGADLLSSTPRQLLLYRLLGLKEPVFCHFPLLLDSGGRRLSKRNVGCRAGHPG